MPSIDAAISVYLGRDLVERLDAFIAGQIGEMDAITVLKAARKRGGLPNRSTVTQQALVQFLTRRGY